MNIAMNARGAGDFSRPLLRLGAKVLTLIAMVLVVSCALHAPNMDSIAMTGSYIVNRDTSRISDVGDTARQKCKLIYSGVLITGRTFKVFASDGFRLDATLLLMDSNRILRILAQISPWALDKDLDLYFLHVTSKEKSWKWAFRAGDSISYLFIACDGVTENSLLAFSVGRPGDWDSFSGECLMASEYAHELTHLVAPIYFVNAKGALHCHGGMGWFGEGLAEYVNYLSWEGSDRCPWNMVDTKYALEAFANASRRQHLWRWQSGIDDDWAPHSESTSHISDLWPDQGHLSRASFLSPDYTTALGAFLYLEKALGRAHLQRIIHQIIAQHRWQGRSFYSDLNLKLGFDIRNLTSEQIRATMASSRELTATHVP